MVTGFAREEVIQQIKETNLDGFLLKPVTGSVFVDTLMQAFGHRQQQRRIPPSQKPQLEIQAQVFGAKILLVEDNLINQQIAQELLEGVGFHVTVVDNGEAAVTAVTEQAFDLVLMDIHMPRMDGYQATQSIRNNDQCKHLPIIAMTANAMASDKQKCLDTGMNDHIAKPIDPDQLYQTLNRWVRLTSQVGHKSTPEDAPKTVTFPATMDGINIHIGLSKVRQNRHLYLKILRQFSADYATADNTLTDLLVNDLNRAKVLVHTLKGVSGNIGAQSLYEASMALESDLQNGDDIETSLPHFKRALHQVIRAIAGINDVNTSTPTVVAQPRELREMNVAVVTPLLQQLATLLHKRNLKASTIIDNIKYALDGSLPTEFDQLASQIDDFEFEQATTLLQEVAGKLKIKLFEEAS